MFTWHPSESRVYPEPTGRHDRSKVHIIVFDYLHFSFPLFEATCRRGLLLHPAWSSLRSADSYSCRAEPWGGGHLPWTPNSSSEPFPLREAAICGVEGMCRGERLWTLRGSEGLLQNKCSSLWEDVASHAFRPATDDQLSATVHWYVSDMLDSICLKASEVNGGGQTTLSFGSYYGPSQSYGMFGNFQICASHNHFLIHLLFINNLYKCYYIYFVLISLLSRAQQRCTGLFHSTKQLDSHQGGETYQILRNRPGGWDRDAHCLQISKAQEALLPYSSFCFFWLHMLHWAL